MQNAERRPLFPGMRAKVSYRRAARVMSRGSFRFGHEAHFLLGGRKRSDHLVCFPVVCSIDTRTICRVRYAPLLSARHNGCLRWGNGGVELGITRLAATTYLAHITGQWTALLLLAAEQVNRMSLLRHNHQPAKVGDSKLRPTRLLFEVPVFKETCRK